jgi:D-amino-acid dehydrogenase
LLRNLHLASRGCFEELAEIPGNDFGLVKKGMLMLCKTGHALEEEAETAEQARELGIPAEVLDAKQTATLEPNVRMDIAGSVYFPKDCHLSPNRFMSGLKQRLAEGGVEFLWETDVLRWSLDGNRIRAVLTTRGVITADEFVLCGGSGVISRDLPLDLQYGGQGAVLRCRSRQFPQICAIFFRPRCQRQSETAPFRRHDGNCRSQ